MKRHRPQTASLDNRQIDKLYGLEPVFEPYDALQSAAAASDYVSVSCPYCGESFGTPVDTSAGSCTYIEDCQVCCQPIEMTVSVSDDGALLGVEARRGD